MYYVYAHVNPETEALLYIGKGTDGRAWKISCRKAGHLETLENYVSEHGRGSYVRIIADDLESDEAFTIERQLIWECKPPFNSRITQPDTEQELDWKDLQEDLKILWKPS